MTSDPRDYKLDIAGLGAAEPAPAPRGLPYLSVLFNCCRVYQRVYRRAGAEAYVGRCPKCGRTIRFEVGPGGTNERTFVVE